VTTHFGLLTTYPPTQCGLATFSHALAEHLVAVGARVSVVRAVDAPQPPEHLVTSQWIAGDARTTQGAVDALNACDVVVVQHEYGIFGGPDGDDVVDLLRQVRVPVIAVLHTVLTHPTPHQREVLAEILRWSDVAVTMTHAGRQLVVSGWDADPERVTVIPHGAHPNLTNPGEEVHPSPTILTWGLLSKGKGIEWALEALTDLTDLDPQPVYRIVGQTHPKVLEWEGEAYRHHLVETADRLGVAAMVEFDDRYHDTPTLQAIVRSADVVLLPYVSPDQVTSGVLTEAVVAGRPVVSTPFPHAVELLSSGAGLLVPRRDPRAMAAALRRVLTEPGLATHMGRTAAGLAAEQQWSSVAHAYVALAGTLARPTTPVSR
jgi:glycosyltransferase involved in cell wall biosynthesis